MDIMIPVWETSVGTVGGGGQLAAIRGATIALIDDNYDEAFTGELERQLREQYGVLVERFVKPNGSHPSPKAMLDQAARCQAAIVGIGM